MTITLNFSKFDCIAFWLDPDYNYHEKKINIVKN